MKKTWEYVFDNKSTLGLMIVSWGIEFTILWKLQCFLDFQQPEKIHTNHFFFFLGIGLVLLPFLKTLKISNWLEISREVKEAKTEMKDFISEIRQTISMISNTVNSTNKVEFNFNDSPKAMSSITPSISNNKEDEK